MKKYIKGICVAYKLFNFFSPTCIESCDLRFAYVSTGIGVFPVAKLVVLYACVSYREGSRGRPYIFNVDHSVKRCNINVILNVMPTNHQVDHFCVLLSSNGLDRAYTLKIYWEEEEKEREKKKRIEEKGKRQKLVNISKRYFYCSRIKITKRYYYTHPTKPISLVRI